MLNPFASARSTVSRFPRLKAASRLTRAIAAAAGRPAMCLENLEGRRMLSGVRQWPVVS